MNINKLEMYGYVLQNIVSRNESPVDVEVVKDVLYLVDEFIENTEKADKGKNQLEDISLMDECGRPVIYRYVSANDDWGKLMVEDATAKIISNFGYSKNEAEKFINSLTTHQYRAEEKK